MVDQSVYSEEIGQYTIAKYNQVSFEVSGSEVTSLLEPNYMAQVLIRTSTNVLPPETGLLYTGSGPKFTIRVLFQSSEEEKNQPFRKPTPHITTKQSMRIISVIPIFIKMGMLKLGRCFRVI